MAIIKEDEANHSTLKGLNFRKQMLEDKIENLKEQIEAARNELIEVEDIIINKESVETENILYLSKKTDSSFPSYFPTEIILRIVAVDKNNPDNIISDVIYEKVKYAERSIVADKINELNEQYSIKEIVCKGYKPVKAICEKYTIKE